MDLGAARSRPDACGSRVRLDLGRSYVSPRERRTSRALATGLAILYQASLLPGGFGEGTAGGASVDNVAADRDTDCLLVDGADLSPTLLGLIGSTGDHEGLAGSDQGSCFGYELIAAVADFDGEAGRGVLERELGVLVGHFGKRPGNVCGMGASGNGKRRA